MKKWTTLSKKPMATSATRRRAAGRASSASACVWPSLRLGPLRRVLGGVGVTHTPHAAMPSAVHQRHSAPGLCCSGAARDASVVGCDVSLWRVGERLSRSATAQTGCTRPPHSVPVSCEVPRPATQRAGCQSHRSLPPLADEHPNAEHASHALSRVSRVGDRMRAARATMGRSQPPPAPNRRATVRTGVGRPRKPVPVGRRVERVLWIGAVVQGGGGAAGGDSLFVGFAHAGRRGRHGPLVPGVSVQHSHREQTCRQ